MSENVARHGGRRLSTPSAMAGFCCYFACFLGIALGVFIWIVLIASIPIGGTSANNMDGFPTVLLCIFLIGTTPIAALATLILYGSGKKWLTFDLM